MAVVRVKPLDASWAAAYDPWHFEGTTSHFLGSRQRGIFARPTTRNPRARDRQPGAPKLPWPTQKFAPHGKPRSEETLVAQHIRQRPASGVQVLASKRFCIAFGSHGRKNSLKNSPWPTALKSPRLQRENFNCHGSDNRTWLDKSAQAKLGQVRNTQSK